MKLKKLKFIVGLLIILLPVSLFAAGSEVDCTTVPPKILRTRAGTTWMKVTCSFIADDGDASIPTTVIPYDLSGMFLYMVAYYYDDTTAVDDNSDLVVNEGSSTGYDILYGAGTNELDSAANSTFQPFIASSGNAMPIYDILYIGISGNTTNSAEGVLVFKFIQ